MYDYLLREMIGRRGEELDSKILSDEHSIAFIDTLISRLDR